MTEKVDMIASGYEWQCPRCGWHNKEYETKNKVICEQCFNTFKVEEVHHAYA